MVWWKLNIPHLLKIKITCVNPCLDLVACRKAICEIGMTNLELPGIFLERCNIEVSKEVSREPNFFAEL
jgi:hypothetical protein